MIIKRLKCDRCGKEEEYQLVSNPGASYTDKRLNKPKGWITIGEYPSPPQCDHCGHQMQLYATSIDDWDVKENKYKKHFCSENCLEFWRAEHEDFEEHKPESPKQSGGVVQWGW